MRKKTVLHKAAIALLLGATVSIITVSQLFAEGSCSNACNDYVKCAAAQHGRQATAKEKKTLYDGCMMNCNSKKHGKQLLQCYADAQKSDTMCKKYYDCVVNKLQK